VDSACVCWDDGELGATRKTDAEATFMHDPLRFRRLLATRILGLLGGTALVVEPSACSPRTDRATVGDSGRSMVSTLDAAGMREASDKPHDAAGDGRTNDSGNRSDGGRDARVVVDGAGPLDGRVDADDAEGPDGGRSVSETGTPDGGEVADSARDATRDAGADAPDGSNLISIEMCFGWPVDGGTVEAGPLDAGPCPTDASEVVGIFQAQGCPRGFEPWAIVSGPTPDSPGGECCYMVHVDLCGPGGRPFVVDEHARVARVDRGGRPGEWTDTGEPSLDGLTQEARQELAAFWSRAASFEHASVASFARFSLDLLAVGAPAHLVACAHEAALDEIRHAQTCFAMASGYAGERLAPGPFPLGDGVQVRGSLALLAASAAEEGCVGETVAAVVLAEQAARATDPVVRAALVRIAEDEARHAELAWRTVAWAVRVGGRTVREAVERAFSVACSVLPMTEVRRGPSVRAGHATLLEAHGWMDAEARAMAVKSAIEDVVVPAVRALHEGVY
jgi:hypothetical protein